MNPDESSNLDSELDQLVQSAKKGDNDAFGRLLEELRPYFLAICDHWIGDRVRARAGGSDVVQDVFVSAIPRIGELIGSTFVEFRSWCRQILRNHLIESDRHNHRQKRNVDNEEPWPESLDGQKGFATGSHERPSQQVIRNELLAKLSPDQREVVELKLWTKMHWDEIGQWMGVKRTGEAARKLFGRAIKSLQLAMAVTPGESG